MNDNITLIGMPASGKSTVGVILAKILGMDFTDTDLVIQQIEQRKLSEIISQDGLAGFLGIESRTLENLAAHHCVIATGGSAVYSSPGMAHLRSLGRVVYLRAGYDAIAARLDDIKGRGVALREGQTLRELYDERTVLYERYADVIVDEDDLTLEQTVAAVRRAIEAAGRA